MSEKNLSEKEWKTFAKNSSYKSESFVKALVALEKAAKLGPEALLKALDALEKQAEALLKLHKGDKPLTAWLDEQAKSIGKERKGAQKLLAEDKDDDPLDGLLDPKKSLAALNVCKRDPEKIMQFGFTDAQGKTPAALALSAKLDGRMLFNKLQAATGVKTGAYGSARVADNSLILQLDKPLSGLVKKIREPLLACGFRVAKVVLWAGDGSVFEQDDDTEEASPSTAGADKPKPTSSQPQKEKVEYTKARLAWNGTRNQAQLELQKLETAILKAYEGTPLYGEIRTKLRKLDSVLENLSESLSDALEQAFSAEDSAQRRKHHQEAKTLIQKFLEYATNDPFIGQLESNPFVPIDLRGKLVKSLSELSSQLA